MEALNGLRRSSSDVGRGQIKVGWRGLVQKLEFSLKGNGALLNDHTGAARRVDWRGRAWRGLEDRSMILTWARDPEA